MTIPDSGILDTTTTNETQRVIPEIKGEEDLPFPITTEASSAVIPPKPIDKKLGQTDDLTKFRFETGRIVLYIAMGAMGIMVLLDLVVSYFEVGESAMLESAFEAFKLITMTVLGYIFGSSGSNGSNS